MDAPCGQCEDGVRELAVGGGATVERPCTCEAGDRVRARATETRADVYGD